MNFVGFVMIKMNSCRLACKSIRKLDGIPLVNYAIRTLNAVKEVPETFVFCSDPDIKKFIIPGLQYTFLQRPKSLDGDEVLYPEIIDTFIDMVHPESIVHLCCTHPFITASTISDMIEQVDNGYHDSAFAAVWFKEGVWLREHPFTVARLDEMANESYVDNTGSIPVVLPINVRVFHSDLRTVHHRHIGFDPYVKEVNMLEGWDINTLDDFLIAEFLAGPISQSGVLLK